MKKFSFLFFILFISTIVFAETIKLKSGRAVEGKIIEKTGDHINMDCGLIEPSADGLYNINNTTIKFIPPKGWKKESKSPEHMIGFMPSCLEFASLTISVSSSPRPGGDFLNRMKNAADNDHSVIGTEIIEFSGTKAFSSTHQQNGMKIKEIVFLKGNNMIMLGFMSQNDDFDKKLPTIEESFKTFEIMQ